jgi:hypothetical protein
VPDSCQARRQSDEMACPKCHLRWDVCDPDPPLCGLLVATRAHDEDVERSNRYVSALAPDRFAFNS